MDQSEVWERWKISWSTASIIYTFLLTLKIEHSFIFRKWHYSRGAGLPCFLAWWSSLVSWEEQEIIFWQVDWPHFLTFRRPWRSNHRKAMNGARQYDFFFPIFFFLPFHFGYVINFTQLLSINPRQTHTHREKAKETKADGWWKRRRRRPNCYFRMGTLSLSRRRRRRIAPHLKLWPGW